MFLNKMTSLIVTMSMSLTAFASQDSVQDSTGRGLQNAIKTALEKNPKIKSNDKTLEAMVMRVESTKLSQLPSLGLSISTSRSQGTAYDSSNPDLQDYRNSRRGSEVTLNWNVFDGGAKRKKIKSMECSFKERQAQFNSTNTLVRNTQGQVASAVVLHYISLTKAQENVKLTQQILAALAKIRTIAKTDGQILQIENLINSSNLELQTFQAAVTSSANNFEYVVTEPPPIQLDTFQQIIDSLTIPESPTAAMTIALEKSPEIKTARFQIECMRLRYESARAEIYSPRVDVSVGKSYGNQNVNTLTGRTSGSGGTTAGITLTMGLNAGSSGELNAQLKDIESAQDNLDGTVADTKHEIDLGYPELANSINFAESYKRNYISSQANIQKYLLDIDAHHPAPAEDIVKELFNLENNFLAYQRYTIIVLNAKFQIQKTVGTLFESLGLSTTGMGSVNLK